MVSITWKDSTRFAEFRQTRIGRKILARALSKTAVSGKVEGKRRILEVYTVKPGKIKLYSTRATVTRLISEIGAISTDPRGKKAVPLHEFRIVSYLRPKKRHRVVGGDPPLTAEIVRGTVSVWKGGFSVKGANSGKRVAIARVGRERYPTRTLVGPSAGAMLLNTRVVDPLLARLADRLPTVLEQETRFAMDFETDKGKEVSTDDVDE